MEKLMAMHVAAQLTQAACGSLGGQQPLSPDLTDNGVRAKNLQVWETFRVFYRGVALALADTQSWPNPEFQAGAFLPNLLQSLVPLLSSGPLAEILKKLLSALPAPTPTPAGPLPDPGTKS